MLLDREPEIEDGWDDDEEDWEEFNYLFDLPEFDDDNDLDPDEPEDWHYMLFGPMDGMARDTML